VETKIEWFHDRPTLHHKMADAYDYMRYVLQHHQRGMIGLAIGENLFGAGDGPDAWNMKAVAYQGAATFWDVGYVCSLDPQRRGLGLADYYYQPLVYDKYWWCRECHWLPYWGKATCMRRDLMSELRDYWCNRWHNRAIPNIKAAIRDTTRMPEDVIGLLPAFIGCPYDAP